MNTTVTERRAILHCDLDAFYASVEQRDHPEYRGKPVIVGGGPGDRGVVAAASYEARAFGVHSAMPLQTAGRLCPDAIFVPGDGQKYEEASDGVMALFAERTPLVQPISLDEAFLDVTATEHLFGGADNIARELKRDVRAQLGLVISVGVATNKLCAKIGSDLRKPDGLVIVPAGGEEAFLAPLELGRLWGVGPKTRAVLEGWGLRTIGDLAAMDLSVLETRLGEHGRHIWERAHGIDEGEVVGDGRTPKSVGHSHTFDRNTLDSATIESMLLALSEGVGRRLRAPAASRSHDHAASARRAVRNTDPAAHARAADGRRSADLQHRASIATRRARRGSPHRPDQSGAFGRSDRIRDRDRTAARTLRSRSHHSTQRRARCGA